MALTEEFRDESACTTLEIRSVPHSGRSIGYWGRRRSMPVYSATQTQSADQEDLVFDVEPIMVRIGEGLKLSQRGERRAARRAFAEIWDDIGGEHGDPLQRCALAHSMADVQDDVSEELVWDMRALEAADMITEERAAEAGVQGSVRGFYPSLHLNVGECYRKLGDLDSARSHLTQGRASSGALVDDGYGRMIRNGLDRLAERLC